MVGDKRSKDSSHDDEEEEEDEEDGIDKRGGKGLGGKRHPRGECGRGGGKRKKDSRARRTKRNRS